MYFLLGNESRVVTALVVCHLSPQQVSLRRQRIAYFLPKPGNGIRVIFCTALRMCPTLLAALRGNLGLDLVRFLRDDLGLLSRASQLAHCNTLRFVLMFDTWSHRGHSTLASVALRPCHEDSHSMPLNTLAGMHTGNPLSFIASRVFAILTCIELGESFHFASSRLCHLSQP